MSLAARCPGQNLPGVLLLDRHKRDNGHAQHHHQMLTGISTMPTAQSQLTCHWRVLITVSSHMSRSEVSQLCTTHAVFQAGMLTWLWMQVAEQVETATQVVLGLTDLPKWIAPFTFEDGVAWATAMAEFLIDTALHRNPGVLKQGLKPDGELTNKG